MKGRISKGFTVLELMVVAAIAIIVATVAVIAIPNVLNSAAVDSGYAITLGALRQARQLSVDQMEQVAVTFSSGPPAAITTQNQQPDPASPGSGAFYTVGAPIVGSVANLSSMVTLPDRVRFGLPTSGMGPTAPENIPSGEWQVQSAVPISFTPMVLNTSGTYTPTGNQAGYVVVFQPDGSARCPNAGNPLPNTDGQCNGVVYLIDTQGDLSSIRAITLFGATGRIQGYRYNPGQGSVGSGASWSPF